MNFSKYIFPDQQSVEKHPIYCAETIAWQHRQKRFPSIRYSLFTLSVIVVGVFCIWLVLTLIRLNNRSGNAFLLSDDIIIFETAQEVLNWSLFASLILVIFLDAQSITASVNSINREQVSGHWDLLRLTDLNEKFIIRTKHVLAQQRTWRSLLWVVGLRMAVTLLFLSQFTLVRSPYDGLTQLSRLVNRYERDSMLAIIDVAILVVSFVVFLLEPFWRMRALTAGGVMLSARIRDTTRALLAGLGVIGTMWFTQIVLSLLYGWLLIPRIIDISNYNESLLGILTLCILLGYGLCIWLYYQIIQRGEIGLARRFAFVRE